MNAAGPSRNRKSLANYLILTSVTGLVQLLVGFPLIVQILKMAFRPGAFSWDRADAVELATCIGLQSATSAFLLLRLRRSGHYLTHLVKGVLVGLSSFLIAAVFGFLILRSQYEPFAEMTPLMFFVLIVFLGHRIPLLGVMLSGGAAATLHWFLTRNHPAS